MLPETISQRLVKSEDLNHHKTFYAGHCADWFLESSYIAATKYIDPEHMVCLKIHGMEFLMPVYAGDILAFRSKVIQAGKSTITVFTKVICARTPDKIFCDGFVTFVHVDENTKPKPHGIVIVPETEEEIMRNEEAKRLILVSKNK